MKVFLNSGTSGTRRMPLTKPSLVWDGVLDEQILQKAKVAMDLRSISRASGDSRYFSLRRRLPKNDPTDHASYIEIESAYIVETLRYLRDEYRAYLEEQSRKLTADVCWEMAKSAVKTWAVMVLRSAAVRYIAWSEVDDALWSVLFDFSAPCNHLFPIQSLGSKLSPNEMLKNQIAALLPLSTFDRVLANGPFG
jgi:hypothetical protein